jgi:hypothetical protein
MLAMFKEHNFMVSSKALWFKSAIKLTEILMLNVLGE